MKSEQMTDTISGHISWHTAVRVQQIAIGAPAMFITPQFEQSFAGEMNRLMSRPPAELPKIKVTNCPEGVDVQ